jgi:acetyl-CoA carboxylase biotin carboxyl carrier protein
MGTRGGKTDAARSARGGRKSRPDPESGTNHRSASGQPLIDLDFVRELIAAVDQSGIDSLEISRAGTRIRVSKTPPPAPVAASLPVSRAAGPTVPPGGVVDESSAGPVATEDEATPAPEASNLVEIKSPMVGTFYRGPAPDAPPYVDVGSTVTTGQTLCILEAMKLMNELESEVAGVIREVLVENAEPVEYGQVLFRVEPTG